jgi:GntR family transcriptional regulator
MSGTAALDRNSPLPLWAQMLAHLRRRVASGEFSERFPTEAELGEYYGVSRYTVREVLRRLQEEGLLVRQRGRASRVTTRLEQPLTTLYSLARTVRSMGLEERSIVIAARLEPAAAIGEILGLEPVDEIVYIERLRLAGEEPLAIDRSWLVGKLARPLLGVDLSKGSVYEALAVHCGVTVDGGWERISPARPSAAERRQLGIGQSVCVFSVERLVSSGGVPVEWRLSRIRGDRYTFVARWDEWSSVPSVD